MAEYIDRDALRDALYDADAILMSGIKILNQFPSADVAPVRHGRWIVRFDGPYKRRRCYCSHCGKHNGIGGIAKNQEKPYCPNCGVKMDGGAD